MTRLSTLIFILFSTWVQGQPLISSFSPASGSIGTSVTISGSGFNSTAGNNVVFFGLVKASVTAASSTSLTVSVPVGAATAPISVVNTATGLTGQSQSNFKPLFSGNISATSLTTRTGFTTGTSPQSCATGDFDGDGKPDLVVGNSGGSNVSIFRNTATSGIINSSSFAAKSDIATGSTPRGMAIGDVNGDGLLDLVVANTGANTVFVFRNTSTSGSISFATQISLATSSSPYDVAIADFDQDGKMDIASANSGTTTVSIFRNTISGGTLSFAAKSDVTVGSNPKGIAVGDIDGNGAVDIVTSNSGSTTISVLRNTSSSGSISFATKVDKTATATPMGVAIGDLDGDGKHDVAVSNDFADASNYSSVSVFLNTSTSGTVSLANKSDYSIWRNGNRIAIEDMNGDGKSDLVTIGGNTIAAGRVSIIKNNSTSGSLSFSTSVLYGAGTYSIGLCVADFDLDGRPDVAETNSGGTNVGVFRNNGDEPTITSFTPTSGGVGATITITGTNFTGATAVKVGGVSVTSFSIVSATSITAAVASGSNGTVSVTTPYGTATSASSFTLQVTAELLIIGGGGGGGRSAGAFSSGGGGGSGGQVTGSSTTFANGESLSIVVGSGGAGFDVASQTGPANGTASSVTKGASSWTAAGGNKGGNGTSTSASGTGGTSPGGSGNGGNGGIYDSGTSPTAGTNGSSTYSAWGAATSKGENVGGTYYFAGGGGGGNYSGQSAGQQAAAGYGGGGVRNTSGTANTGGGGGGANSNQTTGYVTPGGNGGSGIVIIRYAGTPISSSGTIVQSGGYTYHTFTSSGTMTFSSLFTSNPSSSAQNLCQNDVAATLSVSVAGTSPTYQWYSNTSASTSGGTQIVGATSSSYTPPTSDPGTSYYYCLATSSNGSDFSSVSGAVIVSSAPVAGSISGGGKVSTGASATLTLVGNSGTIAWQSSTDNSSFTTISGQTSSTYSVSNITSSSFYRVVVSNGACPSVTSPSVSISTLSPATSVSLTGSSSVNEIANNSFSYVDTSLLVNSNGLLSGFTVTISENYTPGDSLTYTGSLPAGITTTGFDRTKRNILFTGSAAASDWQDFLRRITLKTTSVCDPESRKITFTISTNFYNWFNGHYYQYYSTPQSWSAAKAYAERQSFFGRKGYLVTISSAEENAFIRKLVNQNSWIGCTDNFTQINSAFGFTKYGSQSASEGKWHWVTGPEKGRQLRTGNASTAYNNTGSPIAGVYQKWRTTNNPNNNEPNDVWSSGPGDEDGGHITADNTSDSAGLWNDLPLARNIASIIEFGGMVGDNPIETLSFTRNILVTGYNLPTINGGGVTVCAGSNSSSLSISGAGTSSVIRWEYSEDNFVDSTYAISNTSNTYTASNLDVTRYYRAILSNGTCPVLTTSSVAVNVLKTLPGNLTAESATICVGGKANLTLNGAAGTISKWQFATDTTGTISDISNSASSLAYTLSATGDYFFRSVEYFAACSLSVNSEWFPVSVINGTPPVGGNLSSAASCANANGSGTLTLTGASGTTYAWQYSDDDGLVWSDAGVSHPTTLSFSGLSSNRKYRVTVSDGTCGSVYSDTGNVRLFGTTVAQWTSKTSTSGTSTFNNSGNWCSGIIGKDGLDIVVSTDADKALVLDADVTVGSIDFGSNPNGIYIDLGGKQLTITGAITGTGRLKGSSASSLVIAGNADTIRFAQGSASERSLGDLTLKAGSEAKLGDTLEVHGTVSLQGASLDLSGKRLVLKSTATATARVADLTGSSLSNASDVSVERFIPNTLGGTGTGRRWRLLTAPVEGTTINGAWQLGATWNGSASLLEVNGTLITGQQQGSAAAANTNGFDFWTNISNSSASIRTYTGTPTSGSWTPMTSTKGANAFGNHEAYLLFIRGPRSGSYSTGTGSFETTLQARGQLKQGTKTVTVAGSGTKGYTLIGNPYPSPLDFDALYGSNSSLIKRQFWIWDASLSNFGGYRLIRYVGSEYVEIPSPFIDAGGSASDLRYIQSGQGFFVEPSGATGGTLTMLESHKTGSLPAETNVLLAKGGSEEGLGFVNKRNTIADNFESNPTRKRRLWLSLFQNNPDWGNALSDGLLVILDSNAKQGFDIREDVRKPNNFDENLALFRDSAYLMLESRPLPETKDTLGLRIWNLKQQQYQMLFKAEGISIGDSLDAYWVDGFLKTRTKLKLEGGVDTLRFNVTVDAASSSLNRFSIELERRQKSVVTAIPGEILANGDGGIRFYPNPIKNRNVQLQFIDKPAGKYNLLLYDMKGVLVYTTMIQHFGGDKKYALTLPYNLPGGTFVGICTNGSGLKYGLKLMIL